MPRIMSHVPSVEKSPKTIGFHDGTFGIDLDFLG